MKGAEGCACMFSHCTQRCLSVSNVSAQIYAELRSEMEERESLELKQTVYVLRGGFTEFQLRHRVSICQMRCKGYC